MSVLFVSANLRRVLDNSVTIAAIGTLLVARGCFELPTRQYSGYGRALRAHARAAWRRTACGQDVCRVAVGDAAVSCVTYAITRVVGLCERGAERRAGRVLHGCAVAI